MESILLYLPNNVLGVFLLFLVFVLGLVFLFVARRTEWIIYALLIWLPLESLILMYTPVEYYSYVKYIPEVIMYGLVGGAFIHYIINKGRILPRQPLNKWIIALLITALVSLALNWYNPLIWTLGMRQLLRFVLIMFVVLWQSYDKSVLKKILILGGCMLGLEVILGLVQYLAGGKLDAYLFSSRTIEVGKLALLGGLEQFWTSGSRLFATMGRYDRLGSFVALGVVMLFPWLYYLKTYKQKVWYGLAMLSGLLVLFLTYSRASWIMAFVGIFVIGLILKKDKRVLAGVGIFVVLLMTYLAGFALIKDNVLSITEKPTQSFGERVFEAFSWQAWRDSYEGYGRIFFIINTPRLVVSQYPVFGVGPGQYGGGVAAALLHTDMYDRLHLPFGIQNIMGQIDNNWMSLWGEFGTVGLIIWLGIFINIIILAKEVYHKSDETIYVCTAAGLVGLTIGLMCLGFFGPYFEFRSLMFYYWLIVGIVALAWHRHKYGSSLLHS